MALSVLVAADTIVRLHAGEHRSWNCSGHYVRRLDLSVNSDNQTSNPRANAPQIRAGLWKGFEAAHSAHRRIDRVS